MAMSLSFDWGPTKRCFDANSPPIKLRQVPKGTALLRFRMRDLNAPSYNHGGGTVKYTGKNSLPYGAFRYKGPCPPRRHTYEITVDAINAKGKRTATAKFRRSFQQ